MAPHDITKEVRIWNIAFIGVVAAAFVLPVVFSTYLGETTSSVGQGFARTLGDLFFCVGFAWLLTRKRSGLFQAKARLVAGLVVWAVLGNNIHNVFENDRLAKKFIRESLELSERFEKKLQAFDVRFNALELIPYMTADSLSNPNGVSAGKAALAQLRRLIQEQNLSRQSMLAEGNARIQGIPEGLLRRSARNGFDATAPALAQIELEFADHE